MKLNLLERIMILNVLPKESNFITLRIVKDLEKSLSFTEEEIKEYSIKQEGQNINWNIEGNVEKEIQIGEKATDIIVESLKKLNEQNKLTMQFFSTYDKFIKS
jgi:hypothetical protein